MAVATSGPGRCRVGATPTRRRRPDVVGGLAAVVLALSLLAPGCGPDRGPPPQSERVVGIPVVVRPVEVRDVTVSAKKVAILRADKEYALNFSLPGNLGEYFVDEGSRIDAGVPVARLDVAPFRSKLREAEVQLEELNRQRERVERFYRKRLATQTEFDQIRTLCDQATENVKALRETLDKAILRAPAAGVVSRLHVGVGTFINPGTPVATLVAVDPLMADLEFTDAERSAVPLGSEVAFTVEGLTGSTFTGRLSTKTPRIDPTSQLTKVELVVGNERGVLRPGMMVTTVVVTGRRRRVVTVPVETLVFDGDEVCVFVHEPGAGEAERRVVTLGEFFGTRVVVERGLRAGESLIVAGQGFLADRSSVRLVDEAVVTPGEARSVTTAPVAP